MTANELIAALQKLGPKQRERHVVFEWIEKTESGSDDHNEATIVAISVLPDRILLED